MAKLAEAERGIILLAGTTGSGKSTTLYSILNVLNTPEKNIVTIEDPIEYELMGITQVQVKPEIGLTFASGLRAFLRQAPDIVMVGEIRDFETADIAIKASLTGQLLLSTLHTNDAASAITRLIDMGAEPFLIASTVNAAVGQRLIRKVCQNCAKKRKLTKIERDSLASSISRQILDRYDSSFAEPVGCATCNNTGYIGRIGIYEVLEMSEKVRHMIMQRANADMIRKAAAEDGMTTMLEDGLRKASEGLTSIAEVLRVIHE